MINVVEGSMSGNKFSKNKKLFRLVSLFWLENWIWFINEDIDKTENDSNVDENIIKNRLKYIRINTFLETVFNIRILLNKVSKVDDLK